MKGVFLVLEGIDGCGKTTQINDKTTVIIGRVTKILSPTATEDFLQNFVSYIGFFQRKSAFPRPGQLKAIQQ